MKRNMRWLMGALLICGLWMFVACANDDNPVVDPETEQLQDGEWTGSGEGRSGTIIVKVTVENHQMVKVTVVNQEGRTAPGWSRQRPLLEDEGVRFKPHGHVDMSRHLWEPEIEL